MAMFLRKAVKQTFYPFTRSGFPLSSSLFNTVRGFYVTSRKFISTTTTTPSNLDQNLKPENSLIISDRCVSKMKKLGDNYLLRVSVEGGGCSGFQTKFDLVSELNKDDNVFEKDGIKVVVDTDSLEFLKGSTIDYEEELIRSSFAVTKNPLADQGCSCGASFSLKDMSL